MKKFTEPLTEKLLRQVGWQGRVQNNQNSPHDVWSPDCRVLTQMYSPKLFLFSLLASWRAVVSFTTDNKLLFLKEPLIYIYVAWHISYLHFSDTKKFILYVANIYIFGCIPYHWCSVTGPDQLTQVHYWTVWLLGKLNNLCIGLWHFYSRIDSDKSGIVLSIYDACNLLWYTWLCTILIKVQVDFVPF
jgi:hypothetical protein